MAKKMSDDALIWEPAHRLAPRIATGELQPEALVEALLARIARLDPKLRSFTEVYRDESRFAAKAAALAIRAGHGLGPLHGIPIAVKDLFNIEGRPTACGSRVWQDRRATVTASVVVKLRQAGMIVIGKTHQVEFAFGGWGTNASVGTPWNPWDMTTSRAPGGSSSGSGVAVAAGLVPMALGSDTGGSVRNPAAMCGHVGLKTTVGRIGRSGAIPLSRTLDSVGPMTRSVEDAALLYRAISGVDPDDASTTGITRPDPLPMLKRGVAGLRLAVLPESERSALDADVVAAYGASIQVLDRLGARIVELPFGALFAEQASRTAFLIASEAYAFLRETIERDGARLDPNVYQRMLAGRGVTLADYWTALDKRNNAKRDFAALIDGIDALLTPTSPIPPIPIAQIDETSAPLARFTRAVNYFDLCALALPCGFTKGGLPLSLQIVGRGLAEDMVLRIGWAYENATDWHRRRPPLD